MRPISLNRALSRLRWHEVAGHGVTGEPEEENLPPRCRELVACSQTRSRDKLVHELARTRRKREGKRKEEKEREREMLETLKKVTLSKGDRVDDGLKHKRLSLEWNPGMVRVEIDRYFYWRESQFVFLCFSLCCGLWELVFTCDMSRFFGITRGICFSCFFIIYLNLIFFFVEC